MTSWAFGSRSETGTWMSSSTFSAAAWTTDAVEHRVAEKLARTRRPIRPVSWSQLRAVEELDVDTEVELRDGAVHASSYNGSFELTFEGEEVAFPPASGTRSPGFSSVTTRSPPTSATSTTRAGWCSCDVSFERACSDQRGIATQRRVAAPQPSQVRSASSPASSTTSTSRGPTRV